MEIVSRLAMYTAKFIFLLSVVWAYVLGTVFFVLLAGILAALFFG